VWDLGVQTPEPPKNIKIKNKELYLLCNEDIEIYAAT
jgi:hypothetical protein